MNKINDNLYTCLLYTSGLACIGSGTLLGVLILVLPSFKNWINATMGGPAVPATIISLVFGIVVSLMSVSYTHLPSFAASSAWLTPCFLRHCFNSSENDMVILLYIQRGILLMLSLIHI